MKLENLSLRKAVITDIENLIEIRDEARRINYSDFLDKPLSKEDINSKTLSETKSKLAKLINNPSYFMFVALIGSEISGWVKYKISESHIKDLYVHPKFQGLGVGTKLLEKIFSESNSEKISLSVLKLNAKAIKFYEKHHFKIIKDATPITIMNEPFERFTMERDLR